jgi:hypothetical protein
MVKRFSIALAAALLASCAGPSGVYEGRRTYVEQHRYWGQVREAGTSWNRAQLVVMDESITRTPDRLPEAARNATPSSRQHGHDHGRTYTIQGGFTGATAYDPNSNLELPIFRPTSFTPQVRTE